MFLGTCLGVPQTPKSTQKALKKHSLGHSKAKHSKSTPRGTFRGTPSNGGRGVFIQIGGHNWAPAILKIQPPTLKQSRTGALYQPAITRQGLEGVVVDNQKAFKTPGMKRSNISMLVICDCTGALKIVKPTLDGLCFALGPSHS